MGKVIWSPAALADVDSIAEYVARDSPGRAALLATRLVEAPDLLASFPRTGRMIPEFGNQSRREIFVGPYRIMYWIRGDAIWITGVVHGSRQVKSQ
jgi:plasmid stabilization system protein ParE